MCRFSDAGNDVARHMAREVEKLWPNKRTRAIRAQVEAGR
jgi:hypothetical protein